MTEKQEKMVVEAILAQQRSVASAPPASPVPAVRDPWQEQMEAMRISFLKDYPADQFLLECRGIGFFARGDIHGIKAKQKSGKTSAIAIMTAALLSGQCMQLRCPVSHPKVLIFDTEQKPTDTRRLYSMVFSLARLPEQDIYERLQIFTLRKLCWTDMLQFIKDTVRKIHPDIVFIDGLVDLLTNFNDIDSSLLLLKELMVLTTDVNCALVGVLHTNKSSDDHNMRGHLGTLLSQKSGTVLECTRQAPVFRVSCPDSRHAPVPDWYFSFDASGRLCDATLLLKEHQATKAAAGQSKPKLPF